jgi:hypothetical protein
MEKITQEEWDEKLVLHGMFLDRKKGGERLILIGYDLSEIVFKENINLKFAILNKCNLEEADLEEADLEEANLEKADLEGANLEKVILKRANLKGTNLRYAYLKYANLYKANLYRAYLEEASLKDANFEEASLKDANFENTIGNNKEIKTLELGIYVINYTSKVIQIGCKNYTIEEWFQFSDGEIDEMDGYALEWWNKHKNILKEKIEKDPALDSNNYWWE